MVGDKSHMLYLKEQKKAKFIINAWATNIIIKDWIKTIYIPFFSKKDLSDILLIWDYATMHNSFEILNYLYKNNINVIFIPRGLTCILLLDLSINRPFKDWIRREYESSIQKFNFLKLPKIKRDVLLEWILNVWNDYKKITSEIIKISFLY